MWRCFVRDQARVPSVAGAGSSLFRNRNNFFYLLQALWSPQTGSDLTGAWRRVMPACARQVEIDMRVDLWPARGTLGVLGDKQRCDREVAVDMLPCCRRGAGVAGAARRDHDGYSDTPGRPVLPDGGTLPRLAHAEKNSETACSRVTDESVRVTPRVPYRSHTSINSLWPH